MRIPPPIATGPVAAERDAARPPSSSSGIGASSLRIGGRLACACVISAAAALSLVSSAWGAKYYDSSVGTTSASPALGGTFASAPRDVAVNDPGIADGNAAANGDFYVVDDANHRIQRFNADGSFDLAWGADVVTGGTTNFEICASAATCKVGVATGPPAPTTNLLNGALDNPQGIAVDQDTGNVYVSDRDNRRISQYTANGVFVRSFGFDVLATANEIQTVTVDASGGSFTISFGAGGPGVGTTGDISATATNATVAAALNGLTNVNTGGGSVTVAGGPGAPGGGTYTITFNGGPLANSDVAQVGVGASAGDPLTGGAATISAATSQNGSAAGVGYEVCQASNVCKIGVGANNASTSSPGPNPGQFSAGTTANGYRLDVSKPDGNPSTGKVFLANTGSQRVETYNLDGSAPSNFGSSGQFTSNQPLGVALDSTGIAYIISGGVGGPLARYSTATTQFLAPISLSTLTGNTASRVGVEIDRVTGRLFVVTGSATAGLFEIATPGGTPSLAGNYPTAFTANFQPIGVGVNPDTGKVFMPTSTTAQRVVVFDDDGLSPIQIGLEPPTNVQANTADLHATINPAPNGPTGQQTSYRFEVSKDGVNWTQVTSNTVVPPNGDTNFAQSVQAQGTNLEPNTSYRVRVVATRANNSGAATSAELAFLTDPAPPVVETIAAQQISDTSAQVVGRINPGGLATSYWFEWGDDDYGNVVPVPAGSAGAGGVAKLVVEALTGLEAGRFYHFRICAQNSLASGAVCGGDRLFQTRPTESRADGTRVYEMVTSPDKVLRRGGNSQFDDADIQRFVNGYPSLGGDRLLTYVFAGVLDPDGGAAFAPDNGWEVRSRTSQGWRGEAILNVPPVFGSSSFLMQLRGLSADIKTQVWETLVPMFESGVKRSTHILGDSGGPRAAGWYPWLDSPWYAGADYGNYRTGAAFMDDEGERLIGQDFTNAPHYRDLKGLNDATTPAGLTPPQTSGQAVFLFGPPAWGPLDLINECTGVGPTSTLVPARDDAGTPGVPGDDTIAARQCGEGSPTDVRGATLGAVTQQGAVYLAGSSAMAMSDSGDRVFFASPDPNKLPGTIDANAAACSGVAAPTGAATTCPPQLFVRQLDDEGNPMVRWISRPEAAVGTQQIAAFGDGAAFEGASRDGRVAYFRTDAPLTADDPNGGNSITAGPASRNSWDLYRYELPADNDDDPAGPEAGGLTRISGGPDGDADAATNTTDGAGGAARFVSDSGDRVYFVTSARIGDAEDPWNAAPSGGATAPGGVTANASARNLYLYDATKSGDDAYRFVAQVPYQAPGAAGVGQDMCASSGTTAVRGSSAAGNLGLEPSNNFATCVRGSSSGDAIVFETTGRLTADDTDSAGDVYLYEADVNRLTRLSAPRPGSAPYYCRGSAATPSGFCNGDLGLATSTNTSGVEAGLAGTRHFNIAEDGSGALRSVFFESRLPLVEDDVNTTMDVYEWREGRLGLVSPGMSGDSAFYTGNSRDGRDVFFWTEQRISAWEIDPRDGDIYTASLRPDRLPDPPSAPAVCGVLADGCQGGGAGSVAAAPTTDAAGDGNANPGARNTISVAAVGAKARRRAARNGVVALRVRSSSSGRVGAVARARLTGGRSKSLARVAKGSVILKAAGTATLRLRLSEAARRQLRSDRPLRLAIEVTMTAARSRTITVLLRGTRR